MKTNAQDCPPTWTRTPWYTHNSHTQTHTTHIHEHTQLNTQTHNSHTWIHITHIHEHTQPTYMNTHTYAYRFYTHISVLSVSSHCLWSQKCEEQGYYRKRRWRVYSTVEHSAVSWARNQTAKTKCLVGPSKPWGRNRPLHFTEEKATPLWSPELVSVPFLT